ncbi:MAG: hypothetical protein J6K96_10230 [Treponema sp.]|nr:hypothetical protein [Treponema sp.]
MKMSLILSIVTGIVSSLIGTFLCFVIIYIFSRKNEIFISEKIAISTNFSKLVKEGETAWKFKIINKSLFVFFFNFDIKLISILYKENKDGTFTQHRNNIPCVCGVRKLTRYEPKWIVWIKRKINKKYTISFAYRPLTYIDIAQGFKERKYDELELSIICTDSLTGNRRFFMRVFDSTAFAEGDFSNDGENKIIPNEVSKEAWDNHNRQAFLSDKILNSEETK